MLPCLTWLVLGCGSRVGVGTSTDWLECARDSECSTGTSCECGVCTRECAAAADCDALGDRFPTAQCAPAPGQCSALIQVCTPDPDFSWLDEGQRSPISSSEGGVDSTRVEPDELPSSSPESNVEGSSATGYRSISADLNYACAVRADDGAMRCWGRSMSGLSALPASGFVSVAAGNGHACGLLEDGQALCWGSNATDPPEGIAFSSLSAGLGVTCGTRRDDGEVLCWGGLSDVTPTGVAFQSLSVGTYHACGIRDEVQLECWGADANGSTDYPQQLPYLQVAAGYAHACAIRAEDDQIECWGQDALGVLDAPEGRFSSLSAGLYATCAIRTEDSNVVCWGDDAFGQTDAPLGIAFSAVSIGADHACGIRRDDGGIECWGNNEFGATTPPGN